LVHTPVHASWLNQVEIYFSMLQRKVLTPNDSADLQELELRIKGMVQSGRGQGNTLTGVAGQQTGESQRVAAQPPRAECYPALNHAGLHGIISREGRNEAREWTKEG